MGDLRILVLGGTGGARALAGRLAALPGLIVTLSLAGRTRAPALPDCAVRTGGFGGADGLAAYLAETGTGILVDATHPFARRISRNAAEAGAAAGVPLVVLDRPPWRAESGDRWMRVADMADAVAALGSAPKRVFVAVGRQEVGAFRAAPQHRYLVRSVEPVAPGDLPDGAETVLARGPFDAADELRLLAAHRIEVVVAKNSGGNSTYGKIAAARTLGLPVVLVDRAAVEGAASDVDDAESRVLHLAGLAKRGV
jgi:precorrin-6A/cobalt-precorrin-6A reductase